jgi:hypothetical protein
VRGLDTLEFVIELGFKPAKGADEGLLAIYFAEIVGSAGGEFGGDGGLLEAKDVEEVLEAGMCFEGAEREAGFVIQHGDATSGDFNHAHDFNGLGI